MATILNDTELRKLIGSVIIDGDPSSLRPNSYVLRLGGEGEFLSASKPFLIGRSKKGIRVPPGHSVALTALETIDFRPTTVEKIYPGCALHAFISPTTDLSREGIVAPTTQVDAGYNGTLNWTITNTSNEERRFMYGERLYRLTILRLEAGEVPVKFYDGDYQGQRGYVRSQRKGPPVGMRDSEWEDSVVEGGPEALLDNLMKSGYPWHALGQRLKTIDQQFKIVSEEYGAIHDALEKLAKEVDGLNGQLDTLTEAGPNLEKLAKQVDGLNERYGEVSRSLPQAISAALKEEAASLQNRWLLASGSLLLGLLGLTVSFTSNQRAFDFVKANGPWIGVLLILISVIFTILTTRRPRPDKPEQK
jgi:deoxycytidine triphosphate deaminase